MKAGVSLNPASVEFVGRRLSILYFGGVWAQRWDASNPPPDIARAVAAASEHLAANPGTVLVFPAGHYQLTEAQLRDIVDCDVEAYGAVFHITATAPVEARSGIQLVGACSGLNWRGGTFVGDGLASSRGAGIWARSDNTQIVDCTISDVVVRRTSLGISITLDNDAGVSYVRRTSIRRCRVEEAVGPNAGEGYGIALANFDPTIDAQVSVEDCTFYRCQRHSLYIARGMGYLVSRCQFIDHLEGYPDPLGERAAFIVARSRHVLASDLTFTGSRNVSIFMGVGSAADEDVRHVFLDGIRITNPVGAYYQIAIGGTSGGERDDATQRDIRIRRLDCYADGWDGPSFLRFNYGHDVLVEDSTFTRINNTEAASELATFNGNAGSGDPDDYSSNWRLQRCRFRIEGSGGRGLRFNPGVLTDSRIDIGFDECELDAGALIDFSLPVAQTNDRIQFVPATRFVDADDFTLSAGWGDAATIEISPGSTNRKGSFTITAGGAGITSNPTVSISSDGYMQVPAVDARIVSSSVYPQPLTIANVGLVALQVTYSGTLAAGQSVTIEYDIGPARVRAQEALYAFNSLGQAQRIARLTTDAVVELGSPGVATTTINFGATIQGVLAGVTPIFGVNNNGLQILQGVMRFGSSGPTDSVGTGAPNFAAPIGSTYRRTDGGPGTSFYVNEDGTAGGWAAK